MDQNISSNFHCVFSAIEAAADDDDDERNVAKECGAWAWAGPRCQGRAGRADAEGLARTPDRHDPGFEPLLVFP